MKTLFQLGFPTQRRFWVGQATGTVTSGGIDYALQLYQQIQQWLAKTADPASSIGSYYSQFQAAKSKADNLYANASSYGETLDTGGTLSDSENAEANQFYDATTVAWAYIQQGGAGAPATPAAGPKPVTIPGAPAAPNATQQAITSAAGSIAKAFSPTTPTAAPKPAVAPAPAPASNLTTPLLIGGGAVALILLVSLARG